MSKPIIAIVGRTNVGKSTLFNRMARRRRAVTEDIPGITRDRIYEEVQWEERSFLVVDTGGFQIATESNIAKEVREQALIAIEEADIIIVMMDAETGLLASDTELIELLRRYDKQTLYVVNKIDGPNKEKKLMNDFYILGVDLLAISALKGFGFERLMERISSMLPEEGSSEQLHPFPRIAIVGRPNVGKSTLVNALLGKNRMIVSSEAGTTRDAVDSICSYYKRRYIIVDTAGIRRRGRMAKTVEKYSFMSTIRNMEECDIVLVVLDASEGIVEMDQKIAGLVHMAGKGTVILLNKWDLVQKHTSSAKAWQDEIYRRLWFMTGTPVLTVSALSRRRVTKVFTIIDGVMASYAKRVMTNDLNRFLRDAVTARPPQKEKGKEVKIYYMSQVSTEPPVFVLFVNRKTGVKRQYLRYLEHQLRERFDFRGVPVRMYVRQRS